MAYVKQKNKKIGSVSTGIACISATFNNIIVTMTDQLGNTLAASSAGKRGYRGAKKSTPLVAQEVASEAAREAKDRYDLKTVEVRLIGPGAGREAAVKAIQAAGFIITTIVDITPTPHNGCRPPKRRRV